MNGMDDLVVHDFEESFREFLLGYEDSDIKGVQDLISFNTANADRELPLDQPNQDFLELVARKTVSDTSYNSTIAHLKTALVENGFEKLMKEHDVDIIMGPLDSRLCSVAGAARYPCGTLPLGYLDSSTKPFGGGRPFGMAVVAAPGEEGRILQVMSAWEATIGGWVPPPQLSRL